MLNPISEFFDGSRDSNLMQATGLDVFDYSPFSIPKNCLELKRQKYHLSYWFSGSALFHEGWTDLAHAFLQGWVGNKEILENDFSEFYKNVFLLVERLKQNHLMVTIPYIFGRADHHMNSSLKVVSQTEKGVFLQGTQMLPYDSLAVNELLTIASNHKEELIFTLPLNHEGLSLHIHQGKLDQLVMAKFEDVFIPWQSVLIQQRPERITQLFHPDFVTTYPDYQRVASLLHQLEWLTGCAFYVAEETRGNEELHIQEALGEMLQYINMIESFLHVSEIKAEKHTEGITPNQLALQTANIQGIHFYKQSMDILQRVSGDFLLHHVFGSETNSEAKGMTNTIWNTVASNQAVRRQIYHSLHLGDPEYVWSEYYKAYSTSYFQKRLKDFWTFHATGDLLDALPKTF
jgi:4-hydroxyphenylacetate 3-monooxygenase